jgi:His/Glu/Gln/Arg/opine family amino acid ABC transporter permease subunit
LITHSVLTGARESSGSYDFDWSVVTANLGAMTTGLLITLEVTAVGMLMAMILALPVAAARVSRSRLLRALATAYTEVMRGVPLFIFLFLVYYGLASGLHVTMTPFVAAAICLGLTGSGYMTEVYRGGLATLDPGQREAGKALGLTPGAIRRKIVFPEVIPIVIPPTVSVLVGLLKGATFVSVIGVADMFYVASVVSVYDFRPFELYTVAALAMIAVTTVLASIAALLERRLGRGVTR